MNRIKTALTVAAMAALVILAGCAPATMQGLREQGTHESFEVDQNYQAVYRTVIANARKCWQAGMITAQMMVTGDLYTDIQSAEVTAALHGAAGVDTYLGIDIKALGEARTKVTTFHSATWGKAAQAVEQWFTKGHSECGPQ